MKLIKSYLKCLSKSCRIRNIDSTYQLDNKIISFFHEDSLSMNLFLEKNRTKINEIYVLTSDSKRGRIIGELVKSYNAQVIYLKYQEGFLRSYREIIRKCSNATIAIACDGPLGPRRVPKKLVQDLAKRLNKDIMTVNVEYGLKLALLNRWDKYRIPLPFGKISFSIKSITKI